MDEYSKRINKVIDMFKNDDLYRACVGSDDELSEWRIFRKYTKKVLDTKWIDIIEDTLVSLDVVVRNPRRFIVVEEDLIDTSRAKSVTEESVKYLAQHTNYIAGIDDDMILPSKLLNSTKEESYMVYENRFIYTLLRRLQAFVRKRYDAVKEAAQKNEQIELVIDKNVSLGVAQVSLRLDSIVKMPFEEALKLNNDDLGPVERLAKIYNIVQGFMVTPFAKEMFKCEPVRPPIQRTNAILKNQNFKKALALWEFLQSYEGEGYEIRSVNDCEEMSDSLKQQYRLMVFFNSVFMQNLANEDFKVRKSRIQFDENEASLVEDYPKTDVSIDEIKTINVPFLYDGKFKETNKTAVISSIDRALTQFKINKANLEGKEAKRQLIAQRKAEKQYKDNLLKLRREEAKEKAKLVAEQEKIRLQAEVEKRKIEANALKAEKIAKINAEQKLKAQKALQAEIERMQKNADNIAVEETKTEQMNANRAIVSKEIINVNKLRMQLKAELSKNIDKEVDGVIKSISKIYNKKF